LTTEVALSELTAQSCPSCGGNDSAPCLQAPDRFHMRDITYQLVRCSDCSLVWLQDPPKPEQMSEHYGADYHKLITTSGEVDLSQRWRSQRQQVLKMLNKGALLDVGCSSGAFLRSLKDTAIDLYGIEISPEEARRAELGSGARVFAGEILNAKFSPGTFDIITCFHVLEHVHDVVRVLERLTEWLKPGGSLYILVPNIEAAEARIFGSHWYGLELPRHLYHFSPSSLSRLLRSVGLSEVVLRTLPDCYVEKSIRYLVDTMLVASGSPRPSLAASAAIRNIPWRVLRKAFRLGLLWPFRQMAASSGHGAAIEAIFQKPALTS